MNELEKVFEKERKIIAKQMDVKPDDFQKGGPIFGPVINKPVSKVIPAIEPDEHE